MPTSGDKLRQTICISGWAQRKDALAPLCSQLGITDALHFSSSEIGELAGAGGHEKYSKQLLSIIESRCSSPLTAIGWSMGGMILLECLLSRPELFSRLILLGSTLCFCRRGEYEHGATPDMLHESMNVLKLDRNEFFRGFFHAAFHPVRLNAQQFRAEVDASTVWSDSELLAGIGYLTEFDLHNRVEQPEFLQNSSARQLSRTAACQAGACRILVAHGVEDQIIPAGAGDYLTRALQRAGFNCSFLSLPSQGHGFTLDPDRTLVEAIRSIL